MNMIITVSRQFESGGRLIGAELSKRLGIPCYEKTLFEGAAKHSGIHQLFFEQAEGHNDRIYANTLSCRYTPMDMSLDDRMYIVGRYARRGREYGLGPASFGQYVTHRSKRYIACSDFLQRSRCAHSPARPLNTGSALLDSGLDFARLAFSARWHKRKTRLRRVFF